MSASKRVLLGLLIAGGVAGVVAYRATTVGGLAESRPVDWAAATASAPRHSEDLRASSKKGLNTGTDQTADLAEGTVGLPPSRESDGANVWT